MIVALNAGSSSLKFAIYAEAPPAADAGLVALAHGAVTRIHEPTPFGEVSWDVRPAESFDVAEPGHGAALGTILGLVAAQYPQTSIRVVGHRVVHGGEIVGHAAIDGKVEAAIERAIELAPIHNPPALDVIRQARRHLGEALPMAAVFDTGFFADLDPRTRHYPLPWDLARRNGIQRYGFHGIAHHSMAESASRVLGTAARELSLVTLQLGNGCSAALIHRGRAVDTTMGMTPLEGLMMGTRSGSIDPALVSLIADREGLSAADVTGLLNDESGLLGVSGVSSDMRDVMAAAATGNERASLAVAMFAYRVRKQIGAFLAAAGPVDAIVFGGGIGGRSAGVRRAVCEGLDHVGVRLDEGANRGHTEGDADLSGPGASVRTLVAEVDEMRTIAAIARDLSGAHGSDAG